MLDNVAMTPEYYDSEFFEKMIARIHSILEGSKSSVTWNDRIVDPDNENKTRQIDVSVKTGKFLTIIECRIHKNKQNVKWIEELIGRRMSLNADAILAVSSSGFTEGAILKARKYGIVTRDFLTLTEQEIKRWGSISNVIVNYIRFETPELILKLNSKLIVIEEKRDEINEIFYNAAHKIANQIADHIPKNKKIQIDTGFRIEKRKPNALDVNYVKLKSNVEKVVQRLETVSVFCYGQENEQKLVRDVFIENFQNVANIEHVKDYNIVVIDFSKIEQPSNTVYHSTEVTLKNMNIEKKLGFVQQVGFQPNLILEYKLKIE
jgi:hypothetical protein